MLSLFQMPNKVANFLEREWETLWVEEGNIFVGHLGGWRKSDSHRIRWPRHHNLKMRKCISISKYVWWFVRDSQGQFIISSKYGTEVGLFTANSHRIKGTRASKFGDNCKTLLCPLPFSQNNKLPQYHLLEHFIGHQKAIKIWSFLESSTKSALKMSHLYECWCSINGNPVIPKVFGLREVQAGGMHGFFFSLQQFSMDLCWVTHFIKS